MTREDAIRHAATGAPLGPAEMAAIFNLTYSGFHKNAARGLYDVFKVNPPLGPKQYSGILITRWLAGEPLYVPTFGRKRKAS